MNTDEPFPGNGGTERASAILLEWDERNQKYKAKIIDIPKPTIIGLTNYPNRLSDPEPDVVVEE